jgi:hypothetical protein
MPGQFGLFSESSHANGWQPGRPWTMSRFSPVSRRTISASFYAIDVGQP